MLRSLAFDQIHGGVGGSPGGWEVHISYHNGDHYNRQEMNSCLSWIITPLSSVRRIGDDGGHGPPQRIRLCLASSSPPRIGGNRDICDNHSWRGDQDEDRDSGQESDYENHPGGGRLKKLAGEVIFVNPSFLKSSSGSYSSSGKPHGWCWNGKGCLWGPGGQSVLRHRSSRFSSQWYQWAVSSFVQLRCTHFWRTSN